MLGRSGGQTSCYARGYSQMARTAQNSRYMTVYGTAGLAISSRGPQNADVASNIGITARKRSACGAPLPANATAPLPRLHELPTAPSAQPPGRAVHRRAQLLCTGLPAPVVEMAVFSVRAASRSFFDGHKVAVNLTLAAVLLQPAT